MARPKSPCRKHSFGPWEVRVATYETGKKININFRKCRKCDAIQYEGV